MVELIYVIMDDGPCAGHVEELNVGDRILKLITDHDGVCVYRRHSFGPGNNHIAHFHFTHHEVV